MVYCEFLGLGCWWFIEGTLMMRGHFESGVKELETWVFNVYMNKADRKSVV